MDGAAAGGTPGDGSFPSRDGGDAAQAMDGGAALPDATDGGGAAPTDAGDDGPTKGPGPDSGWSSIEPSVGGGGIFVLGGTTIEVPGAHCSRVPGAGFTMLFEHPELLTGGITIDIPGWIAAGDTHPTAPSAQDELDEEASVLIFKTSTDDGWVSAEGGEITVTEVQNGWLRLRGTELVMVDSADMPTETTELSFAVDCLPEYSHSISIESETCTDDTGVEPCAVIADSGGAIRATMGRGSCGGTGSVEWTLGDAPTGPESYTVVAGSQVPSAGQASLSYTYGFYSLESQSSGTVTADIDERDVVTISFTDVVLDGSNLPNPVTADGTVYCLLRDLPPIENFPF